MPDQLVVDMEFWYDPHLDRWLLRSDRATYTMARWAYDSVSQKLGRKLEDEEVERLLSLWRETRIDQGFVETNSSFYAFIPDHYEACLWPVPPC